jgi:retron-type reverse transcriptase
MLDRFLQQALLQVLQPLIDPAFSDASYGLASFAVVKRFVRGVGRTMLSGGRAQATCRRGIEWCGR